MIERQRAGSFSVPYISGVHYNSLLTAPRESHTGHHITKVSGKRKKKKKKTALGKALEHVWFGLGLWKTVVEIFLLVNLTVNTARFQPCLEFPPNPLFCLLQSLTRLHLKTARSRSLLPLPPFSHTSHFCLSRH